MSSAGEGTGARTGTRPPNVAQSGGNTPRGGVNDPSTRPPYSTRPRYAFGLRLGLWYATLFVL